MGQLNLHRPAMSRWCYTKTDKLFVPKSHILRRTFKNLISTHSLNCAESCDIDHAHFARRFFSQMHEMLQTYFFKLLPGTFTDLNQTLHTASLDCPWHNGVQRKSRLNTIAKLQINNFLMKIAKTGSVTYLHIGVSTWHETWVSISTHSL